MLYGIQLCRAIAALLVVFFHSAGNLAKEKYFGAAAMPLERIFWFGGDAGVAFFFVLSGFIIFHVHKQDLSKPSRLPIYIKKRALRIYPTYIIVFLAVYLAAKATPALRDTVPSDPFILLKSLLLLPQDIQVVGGTGAPVIVAAWSLQYEIFFYTVFALALIRSWLFLAIAVLIVVHLVVQPLIGPYEFPGTFFANHLMLLFGVGIATAVLVRVSQVRARVALGLVFAATGLFATVAVLATTYRTTYQKPFADLAYGFASALLILGVVKLETQTIPPAGFRWFRVLGDASYALYLLHFPLIAVMSKVAIAVLPVNTLSVGVAFLLFVICSVAVAIGFNLWVERPLLNNMQRFFQVDTTPSKSTDTDVKSVLAK